MCVSVVPWSTACDHLDRCWRFHGCPDATKRHMLCSCSLRRSGVERVQPPGRLPEHTHHRRGSWPRWPHVVRVESLLQQDRQPVLWALHALVQLRDTASPAAPSLFRAVNAEPGDGSVYQLEAPGYTRLLSGLVQPVAIAASSEGPTYVCGLHGRTRQQVSLDQWLT